MGSDELKFEIRFEKKTMFITCHPDKKGKGPSDF